MPLNSLVASLEAKPAAAEGSEPIAAIS